MTKSELAAHRILKVVDLVEARCMAADGPVTPTTQEIGERELQVIWRAAKTIADSVRRK